MTIRIFDELEFSLKDSIDSFRMHLVTNCNWQLRTVNKCFTGFLIVENIVYGVDLVFLKKIRFFIDLVNEFRQMGENNFYVIEIYRRK